MTRTRSGSDPQARFEVVVPPIPARLEHRPTSGGLVHPWVNVTLAGGGVDFRSQHRARSEAAWTQGLCQVCGDKLTVPLVLLGGPNQLERLLFDEPPCHPECAAYASQACPMVAGRLTHYPDRQRVSQGHRGTKCPDPGCECDGWVPDSEGVDHGGEPAHVWYAVYASGYSVAFQPDGRLIGGALARDQVLKVRLVSRPGEGRCWTSVDDPPIGAVTAMEEAP